MSKAVAGEKSKASKWGNFLIWFFPILFLIDDILGFNGYQFTIFGQSIRIVLFSLSVAILFVYCLWVCREKDISLLPGRARGKWLFSMLKPVDYAVFIFIVANGLWATVVPLLVRGEMIYSLKDFSTILVMVLYFPVTFLIRTGKLKLELLEKMVYILCLILAVWHVVMYVGEVMAPGFYASYYDWIDVISFGTAVRSDVVYGFGITRVIQTTSLFLIVGIFLSIRYALKGKLVHLVSMVIFTFAICVTYTKSIWFGCVAGVILYLVMAAFCAGDSRQRKRSLLILAFSVVTVIALNYTAFDNTIFSRTFNTVRSQEEIDQLQEELNAMIDQSTQPTVDPEQTDASAPTDEPVETKPAVSQKDIEQMQNQVQDAKGTQVSLEYRSQQNTALFNKWRQSKWVGFGYGAYAEDCVRNETYPFMYENTLPALIMKLGVLGCVVWLVFIAVAVVSACRFFWKRNRSDLFWWLAMALAYAMAVQTNPFLFTFTGFSILLYLMISMQEDAEVFGS